MSTISARGITFIEIILVVTLVGVVFVPLMLTYGSYKTTRALYASLEGVANQTTSAHIFARDAKDQKDWGIKNTGEQSYSIYSSGASGIKMENNYVLDSGVFFAKDFDILFAIGKGTTSQDYEITLGASNGQERKIVVTKSGVVEELYEE